MNLIRPDRRQLIKGLAAFIAAPAIMRVASIMPVKAFEPTAIEVIEHISSNGSVMWISGDGAVLWSDSLSQYIRESVMPLVAFRQFADA